MSGERWPLEPIPKEVTVSLHEKCEMMLTYMDGAGNSKQLVAEVLEAILGHLQDSFLANVDKIDLETANSINIDMIMLTLLVRVMVNNPMYDSPALTLQLQNELSGIIDNAKGFKLDG